MNTILWMLIVCEALFLLQFAMQLHTVQGQRDRAVAQCERAQALMADYQKLLARYEAELQMRNQAVGTNIFLQGLQH